MEAVFRFKLLRSGVGSFRQLGKLADHSSEQNKSPRGTKLRFVEEISRTLAHVARPQKIWYSVQGSFFFGRELIALFKAPVYS